MTLCACLGCDSETVDYQCRPVDVNGWEQFDTIMFVVDSLPASDDYLLNIGLRTTSAFPYQSIYIQVEQNWKQPDLHRCDTLKCTLATPNGDIVGSGISHFQYVFELDRQALATGQRGTLVIRHLMRRELLPGVASIGIKLSRAN